MGYEDKMKGSDGRGKLGKEKENLSTALLIKSANHIS